MRSVVRFALTAALLLAAPAGAQETGTRLKPFKPAGSAMDKPDELEARRVLLAYSNCLLQRSRPIVERYLATIPGTAENSGFGRRFSVSACLVEGELRFNSRLLRGTLFELLYRRDFSRNGTLEPKTIPAIDYGKMAPPQMTEDTQLHLAMVGIADCVVRARPAEASSLISGKIDEGEEREFAVLNSAFNACLMEGEKLSVSRPFLRSAVAEALYNAAKASAKGEQP
jgi:hypothetical protein